MSVQQFGWTAGRVVVAGAWGDADGTGAGLRDRTRPAIAQIIVGNAEVDFAIRYIELPTSVQEAWFGADLRPYKRGIDIAVERNIG